MEMNTRQMIERDQDAIRKEVLARRIVDAFVSSLEKRGLTPDTPVNDVMVVATDTTAAIAATLAEAVDILEAIIWASDGCAGHKNCAHSMEPWQRARTLLAGKWEAYENCRFYGGNEWPQSITAPK